MANYQTISEFLLKPFGTDEDVNKDQTYATKYRALLSKSGIKLKAVAEVEKSWYFHVTVASESQQGYAYDVVIRFFTDKPEVLKEATLRNYYVQFFSNAPSFMYKYAYLYKQRGFLIEALYDKLDPDYIDTPPEKTNAAGIISYDKSIYCACRFLDELKFRYLQKNGHTVLKKVNRNKFFADISDFRSVKIDQAVINEEKKLDKMIGKESESKFRSNVKEKRGTTKSTSSRERTITSAVKKTAGGRIAKKTASKSTRKK